MTPITKLRDGQLLTVAHWGKNARLIAPKGSAEVPSTELVYEHTPEGTRKETLAHGQIVDILGKQYSVVVSHGGYLEFAITDRESLVQAGDAIVNKLDKLVSEIAELYEKAGAHVDACMKLKDGPLEAHSRYLVEAILGCGPSVQHRIASKRGTEVFGNHRDFAKWLDYDSPYLKGPARKAIMDGRVKEVLDELGRIEHGVF